ncbi:hypothetical protein [Streptomyces bobili]
MPMPMAFVLLAVVRCLFHLSSEEVHMVHAVNVETARRCIMFLAGSLTVFLTVMAAAVGGWVGYAATVGSESVWRAVAAGISGLVAGAGADSQIVGPLLRPLYALDRTGATAPGEDAPAVFVPVSIFGRLEDAIRVDAADRAAGASWNLDRSGVLLGAADEWEGETDGSARFDLPFGSYVLYQPGPGPETVFTIVAPDSHDQVAVTSLLQLQGLLWQLGGGGPVETVTA